MTRGEKFAWIWVWSAMTLLSIALILAVWRYGKAPSAYLDAMICASQNEAVASPACERAISLEQAPAGIRATALRRLAAIAASNGKPDVAIERVTSLIQLDAATAEDWNLRGLSYYTLGNHGKAAEDFHQAALLNGAEGVYWSNLADAQIQTGKFGEALQNYGTAMQKGNDNAEIRGNHGWANYQLGKYEDALKDYDGAIAMDAEHADNINERGLVRHALQDYRTAIADFDRSLQLQPNSAVILTNRAMSYSRLGDSDNTRQDLDRAISIDPKYAAAYLERAWLLINEDRPQDALAELRTLESIAPLGIYELEARCRAQYDLGNWAAAIGDADSALAMGSKSDWPYEYRGKAKYESGDYDGAIADTGIVIQRNPASIGMLVTRAYSLQLSGRSAAAVADMDSAIRNGSDLAYAYETRGYLHLNAGQLNEALADARQSVALAPQSDYSALTLAFVLLESEMPAAALAECNRALAIRETAPAYRCRAIAQLDLQEMEAARHDVQRAYELNKTSGNNYLVLGRIDLAQGKAESALENFNQAMNFKIYNNSVTYMYRGDAERALGNVEKARLDYQTARKRDLGLYAKALDERLKALPGP